MYLECWLHMFVAVVTVSGEDVQSFGGSLSYTMDKNCYELTHLHFLTQNYCLCCHVVRIAQEENAHHL